jgi:hypothetical protein
VFPFSLSLFFLSHFILLLTFYCNLHHKNSSSLLLYLLTIIHDSLYLTLSVPSVSLNLTLISLCISLSVYLTCGSKEFAINVICLKLQFSSCFEYPKRLATITFIRFNGQINCFVNFKVCRLEYQNIMCREIKGSTISYE